MIYIVCYKYYEFEFTDRDEAMKFAETCSTHSVDKAEVTIKIVEPVINLDEIDLRDFEEVK